MGDVYAYVATGWQSNQFGVIDLNTGVFTSLGSMGQSLAGLGSYDGVIYGGAFHGNTLYSVNTSTGALTAVGSDITIQYGDFGSTISGLYGFGDNGDLYSINAQTGAATLLGPTGLSYSGIVTGMSSGSSTLYFTQNNSIYSLSTVDGHATLIGTVSTSQYGFSAEVSIGGVLYAGAYDGSTPDVYILNTQNLAATFLAASPSTPYASGVAGFYGLAALVTPVNQIVVSSGTTSVTIVDASNTYLVESGGTLDILNGGLVSGPITVVQGGELIVSSGGTALSTMISSGGGQYLQGGTASGTTIDSGGGQYVQSGGTACHPRNGRPNLHTRTA